MRLLDNLYRLFFIDCLICLLFLLVRSFGLFNKNFRTFRMVREGFSFELEIFEVFCEIKVLEFGFRILYEEFELFLILELRFILLVW